MLKYKRKAEDSGLERRHLSVTLPKPLKFLENPKPLSEVNISFPNIESPPDITVVSLEPHAQTPVSKKPRFLEQLEIFLKRELRHLNATDGKPSELRLQAHRQVFECLIEHFRTYRPLMAAIKNEYEMMLAHQKRKIRELQPLHEAIFTREERHQKGIMEIKEEEKKEIANLRYESRRLLKELSVVQTERLDLEKQVERLNEKVEEENRKFRENNDRRMLLLAELSSLRFLPELYL